MRKSSTSSPAKTVDEYLVDLPEDKKIALEELRQAITEAAPMADEVISYQIPTYKYKGALVHFAAFAGHCSFFVVSKDIFPMFKKELSPFKTSGTTIHFSPEKPIPADLIKKIVEVRVKQNEERKTSAKS